MMLLLHFFLICVGAVLFSIIYPIVAILVGVFTRVVFPSWFDGTPYDMRVFNQETKKWEHK